MMLRERRPPRAPSPAAHKPHRVHVLDTGLLPEDWYQGLGDAASTAGQLFGCFRHSAMHKQTVARAGLRDG
ncbi:hypothetical protein T492DRAFT_865307 [Pavlovales sp. CCMP2436]|nr:hypothetical protein T492DRAFT_865307 [Pavlovales sp. CCMP2436]